jgi:crotonobetainyl-CoA:carnitine CoA-transferase CaiB-like acyl-CoA transferase
MLKYSNPAAHARAVVVARLAHAGLPTSPWQAFDRLVATEQAKGKGKYAAMGAVGTAYPDLWEVLRTEPR